MPEIAEVALTAEILHRKLVGKTLESIDFIDGRYSKKDPEGLSGFVANLPMKIRSVNSRGKFLWFRLSKSGDRENKWYIWNTFGLSGGWTFDEKPKYAKCILHFDNFGVIYADMMNFGTFKFSNDRNALKEKLKELSPDFLKDDFDLTPIKKYTKPIVTVLMDQKKIGSGIGNYLAAEILYRAKISPYRLCSELSDKDIEKLTYWIKYVIKLSYTDNHTGYMIGLKKSLGAVNKINYHPEIKLKESKFSFLVYQQKTDPLGNPVAKAKIVPKRTTWWVPNVQK